MKKVFKNRLFVAIITGIICITGTAYAASQILASNITYKDTTVDKVLDDLYLKANNQKVATQVATLTTKGATYTMQNDGYIVGSARQGNDNSISRLYLDEKSLVLSNWNDGVTYDVSVYVPKNTVVRTGPNGGTYNLTVYEWK